MFRYEIEFDEKKAFDDGVLVDDLYDILDNIMSGWSANKIADGIYEDSNCDNSEICIHTAHRIMTNELIALYCSKWEAIDPEDGFVDVRAMLVRKGRWK